MPANTAVISVMSVADRESKIAQKAETGRTYAVPMLSGMTDLPRKRLPLALPIYRMVNMRTLAHQGEYMLEHKLPDTFFEAGQEDQVAQQAQHGMLLVMSKATKADIYTALQKSADQQDPLIVTTKGVIVNGNRRLSAMRDLYAANPVRFASFAEIDCAILPADTDDDEIEHIETRLQAAPDLRLDYGWVEEAIGLKRQVARGMQWPDLEKSWGQSASTLRTKLATLELADKYLAYLGEPRRYSAVADDGQAFTTFVTRQASHATAAPSSLDAERLVFFSLVAEKQSLSRGRVYNYVVMIEDITKGVVARIGETVAAGAAKAVVEDDDDPLAALPATAGSVSEAVLIFLRDAGNSTTVAAYADAVLDSIDNAKRAKKHSTLLLTSASGIHSTASGLTLAGADPKTIGPSITQMVASVDAIAKKIKAAMSAHPEVKPTADDSKRLASAMAVLAEVADKIERA